VGAEAGRMGGGLRVVGLVEFLLWEVDGFDLLCCWQVVCETHVEPVALLRAKVVEYGLDLAQRHFVLQVC
jgi:hypothetical protein